MGTVIGWTAVNLALLIFLAWVVLRLVDSERKSA